MDKKIESCGENKVIKIDETAINKMKEIVEKRINSWTQKPICSKVGNVTIMSFNDDTKSDQSNAIKDQ